MVWALRVVGVADSEHAFCKCRIHFQLPAYTRACYLSIHVFHLSINIFRRCLNWIGTLPSSHPHTSHIYTFYIVSSSPTSSATFIHTQHNISLPFRLHMWRKIYRKIEIATHFRALCESTHYKQPDSYEPGNTEYTDMCMCMCVCASYYLYTPLLWKRSTTNEQHRYFIRAFLQAFRSFIILFFAALHIYNIFCVCFLFALPLPLCLCVPFISIFLRLFADRNYFYRTHLPATTTTITLSLWMHLRRSFTLHQHNPLIPYSMTSWHMHIFLSSLLFICLFVSLAIHLFHFAATCAESAKIYLFFFVFFRAQCFPSRFPPSVAHTKRFFKYNTHWWSA